jgi:AcrR family transcriptional regulator
VKWVAPEPGIRPGEGMRLTLSERSANILTMLEKVQEAPADGARRDRRAERRDATKAEILDAAWALVREHGLGALALRDLAAQVGMRAPSLYQYFPSKLAIYDAMFAQGTRDALAMLADIEAGDTRGMLGEVARRMFEFSTTDPARSQLLFQRTIPGFEPSPEAYRAAIEMHSRVQALLVAHGITDPDAMDLWTAAISGLTNQQLANDPGGDRWERLIDRTVDMYVAYVAPAGSAPDKTRTLPREKGKA